MQARIGFPRARYGTFRQRRAPTLRRPESRATRNRSTALRVSSDAGPMGRGSCTQRRSLPPRGRLDREQHTPPSRTVGVMVVPNGAATQVHSPVDDSSTEGGCTATSSGFVWCPRFSARRPQCASRKRLPPSRTCSMTISTRSRTPWTRRTRRQNVGTAENRTFCGEEKAPHLSEQGGALAVAEGFEPSEGGYPSHAFEACSLGRSDTPPPTTIPDPGLIVKSAGRGGGGQR